MTAHTVYRTFNTDRRREFVRITDDVAAAVRESGIQEGMVLVSAMHITAGVYVNDWEDGLIHDFGVWLEKPSGGSWLVRCCFPGWLLGESSVLGASTATCTAQSTSASGGGSRPSSSARTKPKRP